MSAEAARQRVSRAAPPVRRFPIPLLPKREGFLYLGDQRNTEQFWDNLLRDLRETGAVYGAAIDGLLARGGTILEKDFPVISGAPARPQKKQVAANLVLKRLKSAGAVTTVIDADVGDLMVACAFFRTRRQGAPEGPSAGRGHVDG